MEIFLSIGVLSAIATISMIIQRKYLNWLSVNYLSLFLGIICGCIPLLNSSIEAFNSDLFMIVVVAPLLYFEGEKTRLFDVAKSIKSILSLTIFMSVIALIVAGISIHYIFGIAISLAFILAAISTPTDATAVESVSYGMKLPKKITYYLKNESLFNDASGIILLSMAVFWQVHGSIRIAKTFYNFLYSSIGAIALGVFIALILTLLRQALLRIEKRYQEDTTEFDIPLEMLHVLTPFIIYFLAEEFQLSGIIAVVCAGLVQNAEIERSKFLHPKLAYDSGELSNLIVALFNNIVFIVLGVVLVRLCRGSIFNKQAQLGLLIGLLLYLANLIVRFLYIKITEHFSFKNSSIFALGGVHGAVTFALAYTLRGEGISQANLYLILLSEATLIILSMIVPTIVFRFIMPKDKFNTQKLNDIIKIRQEMIDHTIEAVSKVYVPKRIKKQLLFDLRSQNSDTSIKDFLREFRISLQNRSLNPEEKELEAQIYRYAFEQEREFLDQLAQKNPLPFQWLYREVIMAELVYFAEDY